MKPKQSAKEVLKLVENIPRVVNKDPKIVVQIDTTEIDKNGTTEALHGV